MDTPTARPAWEERAITEWQAHKADTARQRLAIQGVNQHHANALRELTSVHALDLLRCAVPRPVRLALRDRQMARLPDREGHWVRDWFYRLNDWDLSVDEYGTLYIRRARDTDDQGWVQVKDTGLGAALEDAELYAHTLTHGVAERAS